MRQLGIIGCPLGHSISPAIHQAALDHRSIGLKYHRWDMPESQLAQFMTLLRNRDFLGVNVTVPHKISVMPYLDEIDQWANRAGAVNTILNRDNKLYGYNTDGLGFLRSLKEEGRFDPCGKKVLIIGAGGAARAVVIALADQGVSEMIIANRTIEKCRSLVQIARLSKVDAKEMTLEKQALALIARDKALIVNCTIMGMKHSSLEEETPLLADDIPSDALVYDLVYNPTETPLLKQARIARARPLSGLGMLVYQGAASFEIWTGIEAPAEVMYTAARNALSAIDVRGKDE